MPSVTGIELHFIMASFIVNVKSQKLEVFQNKQVYTQHISYPLLHLITIKCCVDARYFKRERTWILVNLTL